MYVDTEKLRNLVKKYKFETSLSSCDSSSPATVGDVKKTIEKTARLLDAFIEELEKQN